jgi:hypothetical protein
MSRSFRFNVLKGRGFQRRRPNAKRRNLLFASSWHAPMTADSSRPTTPFGMTIDRKGAHFFLSLNHLTTGEPPSAGLESSA